MLAHILDCFLDFILPRRCLKCGKVLSEPNYLCPECFKSINFITPPYCKKCGHPLFEENDESKMLCSGCAGRKRSFYRLSRSAMFYDESNKNLILGFKFLDKTENAGYNQSSLLAEKLGKMINLPVDNFSLVRHKRTRPQTEFSGRARVGNVKDAFSVKYPERVKGKRVILIDDVMTTGSTLKESARALRKAGAKSIDILTVARVID